MIVEVCNNQEAYLSSGNDPWIFATNDPLFFLHNKIIVEPYICVPIMDITPLECTGSFSQFKDYLCTKKEITYILEFVELNKDKEKLWVSCDIGMSRSPAIANVIITVLGLDQNLFLPPQYHPNPWITRLFDMSHSREFIF